MPTYKVLSKSSALLRFKSTAQMIDRNNSKSHIWDFLAHHITLILHICEK